MGIPSRGGGNQNVVSNENNFVYQMGMARNQNQHKSDDYDPDSNVYVANLPSNYGKDALYNLFSTYGQIVRYKFVTPDEPSQPGYGFVQFASRKDAHRAIKSKYFIGILHAFYFTFCVCLCCVFRFRRPRILHWRDYLFIDCIASSLEFKR